MSQYRVTWTIDVDAVSPVEAAKAVAEAHFSQSIAMGNPDSLCHFTVEDVEMGESSNVDLSEGGLSVISSGELADLFEETGEHPWYARSMWRAAVASEDTTSGYWSWAFHQLFS